MPAWTHRIAGGLGAAALVAALAAAPAVGRGAIAVQGNLTSVGPPPAGPRLALVDPQSGQVRWRRLRPELHTATPSHNGRRVAFRRGEDLVVAPTLRSRRPQLVARGGGDAEWSPDGRRLAFVRGGAVYVTVPGSGILRRVGDRLSASQQLAWSPDGRRIAFLRRVLHDGCGRIGVGIVRVRTGAARTVFRPGSGRRVCEAATDVAWGPSRRLAVGTTDRLLATDRSDRRFRVVRETPVSHVIWLPGGRTLAYYAYGCVPQAPPGGTICTVSPDGTDHRLLAGFPFRFGVSGIHWWP